MKKALLISSVASMIEQFNMSNIKILQNLGYEVHVLTNFKESGTIPQKEASMLKDNLLNINVKVFDVNINRNPLSLCNIAAYKEIKKIINLENYKIIHSHSPIGGVLARIAARNIRHKGTSVIYTAHGFHFFKGSSLINWIIYYPIEKFLSRYTDILITINKEDYRIAQTFHMQHCYYIPGVGVDTKKFLNPNDNRSVKKNAFANNKKFIILSIGELNDNKNHQIIIKALNLLKNKNIHYIICGIGENFDQLKNLAKRYNLENNVHLLGYRSDVNEICNISSVFAFPSKREGLGLAAIEAMASGLPIITSNVHGINDYSVNGITGFSYSPSDSEGFAHGIKTLYDNNELINKIRKTNIEKVKQYDKKNIDKLMEKIYKKIN